ncbi:MAG: hypothetical protein HXX11_21360 [Desulfuromonadales bacterium]|nr:hypothetical protein [Desulfuromonadales bacterium]
MANEAVQIKIPADIEYKVLGNAFGLMIASGGLLAGNMMAERSLEYWREDIVAIVLVVFMAYRLMRTFVTTMTVYAGAPPRPVAPVSKENIRRMHAQVAQLPETMGYTPEQVIEEVAKRIEAQKAEAAKKAMSQN